MHEHMFPLYLKYSQCGGAAEYGRRDTGYSSHVVSISD